MSELNTITAKWEELFLEFQECSSYRPQKRANLYYKCLGFIEAIALHPNERIAALSKTWLDKINRLG